jgi:putative hydrolase of the HAD superfamily
MKPVQIETVIFDADGVLILSPMFSVPLEKEYGISQAETTAFFKGPFMHCLVGTADTRTELGPYLEKWGWKGTVDEFMDYWFKNEHTLNAPLMEYIAGLRRGGTPCFVATNQEAYRATYMLERMGFGEAFDGMYASAHLGHAKPAAAFFEKLLAELPVTDADRVLFWDDSETNVNAARGVGLHAETYTTFESFVHTMERFGFPAPAGW